MAEAIISGDSVLNDIRKDLAKEVNTDLALSTWEPRGVFDSELFETVVLQADVVLYCGATETAGGVEAVQILVDAVTQGFSDSRVEVDSLDRSWFRFSNGYWGRALSRVWLLTPLGWISIHTLEADNVPVLAGMNLLKNHDVSFRIATLSDMIAEVEGRKPRKKKPTPQTTMVYNTVYNSGAASSRTISSGTPVHREISTPPTPQSSPTTRLWRRFVVGILQKERMRVRRENALMMEEDL